jgi:RecB family endonuclease NucS
VIELHEVLFDQTVELGEDPGLDKDGVEAELQVLIAARVAALREDLKLVRREYPTDLGPVDLLCRDGDGRAVVVEIKRIGEIAGVDQLLRYQERLDRDGTLAPTRGMFVATRIKPQARVYAESRGIVCVEVDLETLRAGAPPDLRLF